MRRAFDGLRAADDLVEAINLMLTEAKLLEQVEFWVGLGGGCFDVDALKRIVTQRPSAEGEADFEHAGQCFLDARQVVAIQALAA